MPRNRFPLLSSLYLPWLISVSLCTGCESRQRPTPAPSPTQSQAAAEPSPAELVPDQPAPNQSTPITVPVQSEPAPRETPAGLLLFIAEHQQTYEERTAALKDVAQALLSSGIQDQVDGLLLEMNSAQNKDELLKQLSLLQKKKTDPSRWNNNQSIDRVAQKVRELIVTGKQEEALKLARTIPDAGDRSRSLFEIIAGLADAGQIDQALALAEDPQLLDADRQNAQYHVVRALIAAQQIQKALRIARQMNSPADDSSAERYQDYSFEIIVEALAQAGEISQALKVLKLIEDDLTQSAVLTNLFQTLFKQKQEHQAVEIAESFQNEPDRSIALASLAHVWLEAAKVQRALQTVDQITEQSEKVWVLESITRKWMEEGQLSKTVSLLLKHSDADVLSLSFPLLTFRCATFGVPPPPLFHTLIPKLIAADMIDDACQITQTLHHPDHKEQGTRFLIAELRKAGKVEKANALQRPLFKKSLQHDKEQQQKEQKEPEYQRITDLLVQGRLDEAQQRIDNTNNYTWKPSAQLALVNALILKKQLKAASRVIPQIEHASLKPQAEKKLVASMLQAGELSQAVAVASGIWEANDRLPVMYEIAQALSFKKNRKLKTSFTPAEQQLARRIVESIQGD